MINLALLFATFFAASYGGDMKRSCFECIDTTDPMQGCGDYGVCVNDTQNFCAECADDDDCGPDVCVNNMCVECRDNAGCDGICDLTNECVGDCTEDDDCDGICDLTTNECVGDCTSDEDCDGICDLGTNECVDCTEDNDCSNNLFCDVSANGVCVSCYQDDQCDNPWICVTRNDGDPSTNFCGECNTDADCTTNFHPEMFCSGHAYYECEWTCDRALNFTGGQNYDGDCTVPRNNINFEDIVGVCDTTKSPVCLYEECSDDSGCASYGNDQYGLPWICRNWDYAYRNGVVDCYEQSVRFPADDNPIAYCKAVYANTSDPYMVWPDFKSNTCGEMPCFTTQNFTCDMYDITTDFVNCAMVNGGGDPGICVEDCTGKADDWCANLFEDNMYSCNAGECSIGECPNGNECANTYSCNRANMCTPTCSDNSNCSLPEFCQTSYACDIDECTTTGDCQDDYVCDTTVGECIAPCSINSECETNAISNGVWPSMAALYTCNGDKLCEYVPNTCNFTLAWEDPFYPGNCNSQDPTYPGNGAHSNWRCNSDNECVKSDNCEFYVEWNDTMGMTYSDYKCNEDYPQYNSFMTPWGCNMETGNCELKYPCDTEGCVWLVDELINWGYICPPYPYQIPCNYDTQICTPQAGPAKCSIVEPTKYPPCGDGYVCSKIKNEELEGVCITPCSGDSECEGKFCEDEDEDGVCDEGNMGLVCRFGQCSWPDDQCDTAASTEEDIAQWSCPDTESGVARQCIEPGMFESFCAVICTDDAVCESSFVADCSNNDEIGCNTEHFIHFCEDALTPESGFTCTTHAPTSAPVMTTTEIAGNTESEEESADPAGANELTIFVVVGVVAAIKLFM